MPVYLQSESLLLLLLRRRRWRCGACSVSVCARFGCDARLGLRAQRFAFGTVVCVVCVRVHAGMLCSTALCCRCCWPRVRVVVVRVCVCVIYMLRCAVSVEYTFILYICSRVCFVFVGVLRALDVRAGFFVCTSTV